MIIKNVKNYTMEQNLGGSFIVFGSFCAIIGTLGALVSGDLMVMTLAGFGWMVIGYIVFGDE